MGVEKPDQGVGRLRGFGEEKASGGIAIKPVNGGQCRKAGLIAKDAFSAGGPVGEDPDGFIGDKQRIVLVKDSNGLIPAAGLCGPGNFNRIAFSQQVPGHPYPALIYKNDALIEQLLGLLPGERQAGGEILDKGSIALGSADDE